MYLLQEGWKHYPYLSRTCEAILALLPADTSSRPWLVNAEKRILAAQILADEQWYEELHMPKTPLVQAICGNVDSLADCSDHSVVRFIWQRVESPGIIRNEVGYAALYQDRIFELFDEATFAQYLKHSRLLISEETRMVIATALECAVLGWTDKKCRMDSVDDMRRWGVDLSLYHEVLDEIAPPRIEVTDTRRRLTIWVYHWAVSGMLVQWAVTQPSTGKMPYVERLRQVAPIDKDW